MKRVLAAFAIVAALLASPAFAGDNVRSSAQPLITSVSNGDLHYDLMANETLMGVEITGLAASGATLTIEGSTDGRMVGDPAKVWFTTVAIPFTCPSPSTFTTVAIDGPFKLDVSGLTNFRFRVSSVGTGTALVSVNAIPGATLGSCGGTGGGSSGGSVNIHDSAGNNLNSTGGALNVAGIFSATLGGFTSSSSGARMTPLSVQLTDSSQTLPNGVVTIVDDTDTTNPMYCNVNGIAATTADKKIAANSWFAFTIPATITTLHCIATGAPVIANGLGGAGLPTGAGGGGGGSSGSNASVGATASAVPGSATYLGMNVGGNLTGVPGTANGIAVQQATAANLNATVVGTGTFATQLTGATNNINNVSGTVSLPTGAATAANQNVTAAGSTATSAQGVQGVTGGVPMPVTGSFSSTPFLPGATPIAAFSVTAGTPVTTSIPAGTTTLLVTSSNSTNFQMHCALGATVAGSDPSIGPGQTFVFNATGASQFTCSVSAGTQNVNAVAGSGSYQGNSAIPPNIAAVGATIGFAQTVQGAAGGVALNGAIAAGSDVSEGNTTDTAWSGTGNSTVIAALKAISTSVNGSVPAGTNDIGKVHITDGTTAATVNASDSGLTVHVANGGAGGTSSTDAATFTGGTSSMTPEGCQFTSGGATAIVTGHMGTVGCTAARAQLTDKSSVSGTALGAVVSNLGTLASGTPAVENVNAYIVGGGGSGGTSAADAATWTAGTSLQTAQGCEFTSGGATALVTAHMGTVGCTAARGLFTDKSSVGGTALVAATSAYGTAPTGTAVEGVNAFVTNTNANGSNTSANSSPVVIASDQAAVATKAASAAFVAGSIVDLTHGQGTMAASVPVAIASNQSTLPTNTAQVNATTVLTGTGAVGTGAQRIAVGTDTATVAGSTPAAAGLVATGSAPPTGSHYVSVLEGAATTGGKATAPINCDNHVFKHITTATDTNAITGVTSQAIYICGWRSRAAGVATWFLETSANTAGTCGTPTQINGVATEAANTGETMLSNFWSGLKSAASNGVCINSTGTGGVDVDIWYTQF